MSLDLFGQVRNLTKAALRNNTCHREARDAAQITLVGRGRRRLPCDPGRRSRSPGS